MDQNPTTSPASASGYTGDVTPGAGAQTLTLDALEITKIAVDEKMSNNCYLLRCRASGAQVLVDAADAAEELLGLIGDGGLDAVVTTHQHWDHHRALAAVVERTGASALAGEPDAAAVTEQTGVPIDRALGHGDTVRVGEVALDVIAIAGHTPGSICLAHTEPDGSTHLFTGDSLFPGGVGNTRGDAEAFAQLIGDVEERIFAVYDDRTRFHPGHGNDGTLGDERPHLGEWRARGW